ncbi:Predicted lipoprotein [Alteromonadaceae bacterium Bs31]|nr:Predicted lipoprotein [Alteromonadaceae bacterium Bs31]
MSSLLSQGPLSIPFVRWVAAALCLAVLLYFVPLVHFTPLQQAQDKIAQAKFDAVKYADDFWHGPLLAETENALKIEELISALQASPKKAAERYGKRLGLSSSSSYFIRGTGTIISKQDDVISIALTNSDSAKVVIELGPVFGNAIRDGSGLLDISQFSNTQEFNAISSEINMKVEQLVFPVLDDPEMLPGTVLRFAGGIELPDADTAPLKLNLIPVVVARL